MGKKHVPSSMSTSPVVAGLAADWEPLDDKVKLPLDGEVTMVPRSDDKSSRSHQETAIDIGRILPEGLGKKQLDSYYWSDEGFIITVYIRLPEVQLLRASNDYNDMMVQLR